MNKIILTSLAVTVMVFGFNANAVANEAQLESLKTIDCNISASGSGYGGTKENCPDKITELEGAETDDESEVADSGNEGSTSAAQESDQ